MFINNVLFTKNTSTIQTKLNEHKFDNVFIDDFNCLVGEPLEFHKDTNVIRVISK